MYLKIFLHLPIKNSSSSFVAAVSKPTTRFISSSVSSSCSHLRNRNEKNDAEEIHVFNSLTKRKEKLSLRHKNLLYWYSCGPTVYSSAHIGHASSYVSFDIIKRILTRYFRINVVDLLNITDIDDKIIKRANQEKKPFIEISKYYEREFLNELRLLNVQRPSIILRVTEHIPEIVGFIKTLIDSKHAYVVESGSVYFDTESLKSATTFFQPTEATTELDSKENKEKRYPNDFALWKAQKEPNEPSWASPWGQGRPGWHIECSTLANIAFGAHLDFHSGGRDLVFPHHHNEIVQCCAYLGVDKWASHWLHAGHLHLKQNVKMSKSLSNTILISDMLKTYSANEFRLFCLLSHYRNDKEFSEEKMAKPVNISNSFKSFVKLCRAYANREIEMRRVEVDEAELVRKLEETESEVTRALADDFNTSIAVDRIADLVGYVNKLFQASFVASKESTSTQLNRNYGTIMSVSNYVESILGIFGLNYEREEVKLDQLGIDSNSLIESALRFRKSIRSIAISETTSKETKGRIFSACDQFRDDLKQLNIEFKDHKNETIWQIKK